MNEYVNLKQLKKELDTIMTDTTKDDVFKRLLEVSSRFVDSYCKRAFYSQLATREFSLKHARRVFVDDLISITSIKLVNPLNDSEIDVSNYQLEPLTVYPKTSIKRLDDFWYADYKLRIVGKWGYKDETIDSEDTVQDNPLSADAESLTVSDSDNFSICQTLLLEDEQVYVKNIVGDVLTIKRAVNETVAASHSKDTSIFIYVYPSEIVQATLTQVNRFRHGLDASPSGGVAEGGQYTFEREPAQIVRVLLNPFKKPIFSS